MRATSKKNIRNPKPSCQPSLREQIIAFVRARHSALSVRQGISSSAIASAMFLDKSIKTYMHYTSDSFWQKWALQHISHIENILPNPDSRFWCIRLKGIELINKVKSQLGPCETTPMNQSMISEASKFA